MNETKKNIVIKFMNDNQISIDNIQAYEHYTSVELMKYFTNDINTNDINVIIDYLESCNDLRLYQIDKDSYIIKALYD